jgi:hypothetical protein
MHRLTRFDSISTITLIDGLPRPPRYPLIEAMRAHGPRIAVGAAVTTFALIVAGGRQGRAERLVLASIASVSVGVSLAYVHEMTVVIAETLLPE